MASFCITTKTSLRLSCKIDHGGPRWHTETGRGLESLDGASTPPMVVTENYLAKRDTERDGERVESIDSNNSNVWYA